MAIFDPKRQEKVREILGDPDLYPSELFSYILKRLQDNPVFTVAQIQLPNPEAWRIVGATGEPAFQNGWVNYAPGFTQAAFWKDPWGTVHLKGLVKNGSPATSTIFTLPAGYRSQEYEHHAAASAGVFGIVATSSDGSVSLNTGSAGWVALEGITFRAFS